jgi:hypothetical protein
VQHLPSFKESRSENVRKKVTDFVVSTDTSAGIMVYAPKNIEKVCERRHPKSLSSVLKKKQQKRSSFKLLANSNKVHVFAFAFLGNCIFAGEAVQDKIITIDISSKYFHGAALEHDHKPFIC